MSDDEILAELTVSTPRRVFGLGVLGGLGIMLVYLGFTLPAGLGWQVFLILIGALSLWGTNQMLRATQTTVQLTHEGLRESSGQVIAAKDNIKRVDRGMFAFKPSNGFVITLSQRAPRAWRPGIWWRMGKRVGIGGVTSAPQAKFMAEMLTAMVNSRSE